MQSCCIVKDKDFTIHAAKVCRRFTPAHKILRQTRPDPASPTPRSEEVPWSLEPNGWSHLVRTMRAPPQSQPWRTRFVGSSGSWHEQGGSDAYHATTEHPWTRLLTMHVLIQVVLQGDDTFGGGCSLPIWGVCPYRQNCPMIVVG